jgi:hypothetical protein
MHLIDMSTLSIHVRTYAQDAEWAPGSTEIRGTEITIRGTQITTLKYLDSKKGS